MLDDNDLTLPCKYDEGFRRIDIKEETGWCYKCELDCPLAEKRKVGHVSNIQDVPLNTPVYLIDHNHNLYIGTIIKTATGEFQRGECFRGDAEYFYRNAIVDWAYLEGENDRMISAEKIRKIIMQTKKHR